MSNQDEWRKEKNWRHLYLRSEKIHRAKQLGIEYPRINSDRELANVAVKLLFICSKNKWRSPTAEKMYQRDPLINARSAGTGRKAKKHVSSSDLKWADVVLVMEQKHKQRLLADFPDLMQFKELHVLDIPDDYQFMDPELVECIDAAVSFIISGSP